MSRRASSPMVPQAVDEFLAYRARTNFKDIRTDISLLKGSSKRVVGKAAPAKALAKEFDDIVIARLDVDTLGAWEVRRNAKSGQDARRRNRFCLRAFLTFCSSRGYLASDVIEEFPALPKQKGGVREWLTPEQVRFLLRVAEDTLDEYLYFALVLFLSTGARTDEAFNFRTGDVDVRMRRVLVRAGKGSGDGKSRYIPVSDHFIEQWMAHIERHKIRNGGYMLFSRKPRLSGGADGAWEWVVDHFTAASKQTVHHTLADPDRSNEDYPYRGRLTKALRDQAKQVTPEERIAIKLNPRVFRRTFACLVLIANVKIRGGYDLTRLQAIMGHEDLSTTRIYLSDVDDYLNSTEQPFDLVSTLDKLAEYERDRNA